MRIPRSHILTLGIMKKYGLRERMFGKKGAAVDVSISKNFALHFETLPTIMSMVKSGVRKETSY